MVIYILLKHIRDDERENAFSTEILLLMEQKRNSVKQK